MNKLELGYQLWQHLGPTWLQYRLRYRFQQKIGKLKRTMPVTPWSKQALTSFLSDPALAQSQRYLAYRREQAPKFFFAPEDRRHYQALLPRWDSDAHSPVSIVEALVAGRLRYFSHEEATVGFPIQWHTNPFSGQTAPQDRHWSEISDFGYGDIKVIWEPNRFGFVYALVRAYWRTGDEHYPELFWQLVEDWYRKNPPQIGVNWKCGQEISFRVMALTFGLYGFLLSPATTATRVAILTQIIAVSGSRIETNIQYALSQRNNHGISEGMGLWTIGLLFPEFRDAKKWVDRGRSVLEQLSGELIYADGAFAQHSLNYHRLMLHDYIWAIRLGEIQNQPLSAQLQTNVCRATHFLYQLQDEHSGGVPRYGQNDGALVLPLNNCPYEDFRPVLQAAYYLADQQRCYAPGAWDEDLLWLFGPKALETANHSRERTSFQGTQSGCYTLRTADSFVFTHCGTYRDRPGQADMLHVDLWWQGQNIAIDPGTYSYNAPSPWNNPLAQSHYHNTITVDGYDQMERAGKFLWLPWVAGRARYQKQNADNTLLYWEGEHNGYQRLPSPVCYRRAIVYLDQATWLIIDDMDSQANHLYRLHWLLADLPYQWNRAKNHLSLTTTKGIYHVQMGNLSSQNNATGDHATVVRAKADSPIGWYAPYYQARQPALSLSLSTNAKQTKFWTLFSSKAYEVSLDHTYMHLRSGESAVQLNFTSINNTPLITDISTEKESNLNI